MPYWGEIAALTTAFSWSFTSLFFTEAGRRIGSFRVNMIRLLFAVVIYAVIHLVTTGSPWPQGLNNAQIFWLALSGLIGLVIGDGFGFKALVMIGPRLTTLLWATAPIMATIMSWFLLGEHLDLIELLGIAVTIGGVSWVIAERRYKNTTMYTLESGHPDSGTLFKGVLLGLGAAAGQAGGLVLSKYAMLYAGGSVKPLTAAFTRMLASMVLIWIFGAARGKAGSALVAFKNHKAMLFAAGGAIFGPFLGVWMSLVAVKMIEAGIAATLNACTPIFIIPVVILYYKEKVSLRAFLGAVLAVLGVTLLFLGDEILRLF